MLRWPAFAIVTQPAEAYKLNLTIPHILRVLKRVISVILYMDIMVTLSLAYIMGILCFRVLAFLTCETQKYNIKKQEDKAQKEE